VTVFTNHVVLKYLLAKNDTKPIMIRWILLLQEFDTKMKDREGSENSVLGDLSRIFTQYTDGLVGLSDYFSNDQLFAISHAPLP